MNKNIEAVLFDADGTLFDTEQYHYEGWRQALLKYGIDFTKEDYLKYSGVYFEELARRVAKAYNIEDKLGELMSDKLETVASIVDKNSITLTDYAAEAVDFFYGKGVKIGMVTSANKENTLLKLKNSGFKEKFEVIVTKDDVINKKPHPEPYLMAAEKLRVDPKKCISFEDTASGVNSASSARVFAIAIPNEFSCNQDFSNADKIFKNLKEAILWVKTELLT